MNPSSRKQRSWLYLVAFPVGHGAVDWGGGALWLLGPAIAVSMGLNPFQLGILFAARQIGAGFSQLPAGFLGDHLKKRGTFLLATLWWVSVAQLLASGSTNYWIIVGFLTLASAGAAAWHPVAMGTMTQWMPDRKAFVLGVHLIGGTIAETFAPLLAGILLIYLEWNQVLLINTIPTIILGVIFIKLAPMVMAPPQLHHGGLDIGGLLRAVVRPGVLAILLTITLHSMSLVAFMSMAPLYFQEVHGFSSSLNGLGLALFLLGGAVASPFVGHISDQVGRKSLAIGGLIGGGVCVWVITFVSSNAAILPLLIVAGILMLAVRSVIIAMVLEKVRHRESTVLGLISSVGEGFAALGAVMAGIMGGMDLAFALISAAVFSGIAGFVLLPVNANR